MLQRTVAAVETQALEPQVITGSMDGTIRLWDLVAGRASAVLTNHKKAVRDLVVSPTEFSFVTAGADNIKKWQCRDGVFLKNLAGHNAIVNALAANEDNVLMSGGDDGSICFWDYKTGYKFQQIDTVVQPGSLPHWIECVESNGTIAAGPGAGALAGWGGGREEGGASEAARGDARWRCESSGRLRRAT